MIKTPDQRQWRRSGVFIFNFEQITHIHLVFTIVNFEKVNAGWVIICSTISADVGLLL